MAAPHPASVARRRFIQASALAGGGWLLGVALGADARTRHAHRPATAAPVELTAYVRIARSGEITLIMPKVEMGQGTWTSLPMLIAEELEVDPARIRVEPAPPNPAVYGVDGDQSTGGSTSVMDCWLPLRTAGATARQMLVAAAAKIWKVSAAGCHAEAGEVLHVASGRRLGYGALAATAATLPVPTGIALKEAKDFRVIGRARRRLDTPSKTDGSARFGIDVRLPGMCYAAIARSPVEGGKVATLDVTAAKMVAGVRQVVNEGEFVATVADSSWAALKGLEALAVTWDGGPNATVQQAALVAELDAAATGAGAIAASKGDAETLIKSARVVHEAVYHQPFLAHATLEPMNATVHWHDGICEVWAGTQAPDRAVAKLAAIGLDPGEIRIHNHLIGGGFGRRLEVDGIEYAARVARHVDSPVKVLWSREQDIQHDRYRPYYVDRLRACLDEHGFPAAITHTIAGSSVYARWSGAPLKNGIDEDAVESSANPAYGFANHLVRYVQHEPTGVPTSWWRGVGPTRGVFVVESFIDELAAAAQQDPVAYRRRLIAAPRLRAVLDLAVERSGWLAPLPAGSGRGVSVQAAFGSFLAQVVELSVGATGTVSVERVTCVLDCGQTVNPDTIHAQLQGGVVFGLSAVLAGEITIANGRVEQGNFNDYPLLRLSSAPRIDTHVVASSEKPGGVGETGTACIAAAVCNAVYAASGRRVRTLPLSRGLGT